MGLIGESKCAQPIYDTKPAVCKRDYEREIASLRLRKTCAETLLNSLYEYLACFDYDTSGQTREYIGELELQVRRLRTYIETLTTEWEESK